MLKIIVEILHLEQYLTTYVEIWFSFYPRSLKLKISITTEHIRFSILGRLGIGRVIVLGYFSALPYAKLSIT